MNVNSIVAPVRNLFAMPATVRNLTVRLAAVESLADDYGTLEGAVTDLAKDIEEASENASDAKTGYEELDRRMDDDMLSEHDVERMITEATEAFADPDQVDALEDELHDLRKEVVVLQKQVADLMALLQPAEVVAQVVRGIDLGQPAQAPGL